MAKHYELCYHGIHNRLHHFSVVPTVIGPVGRDRCVACAEEMLAWCLDQFGPMITNPDADFETGWYCPPNNLVISFSDDREEWATAFRIRWG